MNTNRKRLVSAVSNASFYVICAIIPVTSFAQEIDGRRLEEIVVTAQKREQSLQSVPITVNVLSREFLDRNNINNFVEISKVVPALYFNGPPDGFGQGITLRGVGSQPFVSGISPGLAILLNDVPVGRLESVFTNTSDVEQVMVLKGPQSTLYGKEASSGVIAITTKRPSLDGIEGHAGVELGSNDLQQFQGRVNVPVGKTFAASLSGYSTEFDGEVTNILTGNEQHDEQQGGRLSMLYQPTDSLELLFRYAKTDQKVRDELRERSSIGQAIPGSYTLPADPFDDKIETLLPNGRDTEIESSSLHVNWAINEQWTLTSITGYNLFNRSLDKGAALPFAITGLGGRGITIPAGTATGGDSAFTPIIRQPVYSKGTPTDEEIKTQELRIVFDNEKWSSLYGVFYNEMTESSDTSLFLGGTAGGLPVALIGDRDFTDWSVFTNQTYHVNQQWDVIAGIRYGETDKEVTGGTLNNAGQFGDGTFPRGDLQKDSWDNVSGSFKVVYAASEQVSYFASVAQGYKPGGFNRDATLPPFEEETTISYEVGSKGFYLDDTLSLNTAAFFQTYDDYQVQSFDPALGSSVNIFNNAASVEVIGAEMDLTWLPMENIVVAGGVAYTDARSDDFKNAPCSDTQQVSVRGGGSGLGCTRNSAGALTQDLSGERLAQTSPWSANLSVEYDGRFTESLNWTARGGAAYRDDYYGFNTLEPLGVQGSYTLYDASFTVSTADGAWEAVVYGRNLSDEDYISGFLPGRDGLLGINVIKGLGRTYGVTATYRF